MEHLIKFIKQIIKIVLIIVFLVILGIYSFDEYEDYKKRNEWKFEYVDNPKENSFFEKYCSVSSNYINGARIYTSYGIANLITEKENNENELVILDISTIDFLFDFIKTDENTIFVNGKKEIIKIDWTSKELNKFHYINEKLNEGNDVVLEIMDKYGKIIEIEFKGNKEYIEKTKLCEDLLEKEIKRLQ